MIAGFNTDVECSGTVYHVQTEDKGAPHHVIMSLVYDKGTILASKREAYETGTEEKILKDRVNRQHKLICAAVKSGRIDELKEMTARGGRSKARSGADKAASVVLEPLTSASIPHAATTAVIDAPVARPTQPVTSPSVMDDGFGDVPVIDGVEIVEDYPEILAPEVIEVVSELSGQSRTAHNKLGIEILGEAKFKGGDRRSLGIMICRGSDRKVVPEAQIMVKILGSSFRPVIFHARSDKNGLAKLHLQVPQFNAGRAALLIRAIAEGEEIELRRVVTPGR